METTCILCNEAAVVNEQTNASRKIYNCPNCGVFVVSDLVLGEVQQYKNELAAFFMSRKAAGKSNVVFLAYQNAPRDHAYEQMQVKQIASFFPSDFTTQVYLILNNLINLSSYMGEEIKLDGLSKAPLFYLKVINFESLSYIVKTLQRLNYLEVRFYSNTFFPCGVVVSPKGWEYVVNMKKSLKRAKHVFVLPPLSQPLAATFHEGVDRAIKECDFTIVNRRRSSPMHQIGFDLAAEIKMSRFMICDITDAHPTAYYSAGVAQALSRDYILTCHRKAADSIVFSQTGNILIWETAEELYYYILDITRALYAE